LAGLFCGAGLLLLRSGLDRLRAKGLITYEYPSPLLGPLLELPEVFAAEVLPRLDPADLALVARVGRASRAVVVASSLPRAGASVGVPLKIKDFVESIELLAWAKENGCPWVARTCAVIARHGNLQVLRRARGHDCPWDSSTCAAAAEGGHLEVLVWAREHGCPWMLDYDPDEEPFHGDDRNDFDCGMLAARGGHLDVLRWLEEHGWFAFGEEYFAAAAGGGQLEVLRWMRENGAEWYYFHDIPPWDSCALAAAGGHLEVLRWLRDEGCEWSTETCGQAAMFGHLELLRWLRQNGCPWDEDTCSGAAAGGHLDALRWARQNGCPWCEDLEIWYTADLDVIDCCARAAAGGHLAVLQWAREHGCPWSAATRDLAATMGYSDNLPLTVRGRLTQPNKSKQIMIRRPEMRSVVL